MADFIIAALPWVIMGLSVAVAAARIYKGKTKKYLQFRIGRLMEPMYQKLDRTAGLTIRQMEKQVILRNRDMAGMTIC